MPTYNILDGAQVLLEANKVGQRLVGEFGVKAILPREYIAEATHGVCCCAETSRFFFPIPSIIFALLPAALSLFVTQTGGHIAGNRPPSPLRCLPSFLSREKFTFSFPRRLASNCAYTRYIPVGAFCSQCLHNKQ